MLTVFFHAGPVRSFEDARASDTDAYGAFFRFLLDRGIYIPPSQFEAMFLATAHGDDEIAQTVEAAREFRSAANSSAAS
jgi:glutamate-1-semialdehyde 2,1-aminomutase